MTFYAINFFLVFQKGPECHDSQFTIAENGYFSIRSMITSCMKLYMIKDLEKKTSIFVPNHSENQHI